MAILNLQAVDKHYAKHKVLTGLSLSIEDNEVFGLIGLNGSGKTSLLKCVLDLQQLSSGDIQILNQTHSLKQARSNLVYLPEKFLPPEYMTGMEYLKWAHDGHQLNLDSQQLTDQVKALLDKVDLDTAALQKPVKEYSKGMMQKLGIIACLLSDKDLLILDEPMSGLDPKARVLFRNIVHELKQNGKTVFLCTHILSDIEQLCDRVGILHAGHLLFVGSPEQCCQTYGVNNLEQAFLKAIDA